MCYRQNAFGNGFLLTDCPPWPPAFHHNQSPPFTQHIHAHPISLPIESWIGLLLKDILPSKLVDKGRPKYFRKSTSIYVLWGLIKMSADVFFQLSSHQSENLDQRLSSVKAIVIRLCAEVSGSDVSARSNQFAPASKSCMAPGPDRAIDDINRRMRNTKHWFPGEV